MDTPKDITHISLCAGYGGIDLGLKLAIPNLRTIAVSEIEAFPVANLVSKMEAGLMDSAPIWSDLKTFPWDGFLGKVDILSGGFPCQPFSAAGKRAGDEDPRHLFPYILEGIRRCRPAIVFLENVEGILSAKLSGEEWRDPAGTPVLLHVLRELERVGYRATAGIFSASECGAPHQRKRVFIAGVAVGLAHPVRYGSGEGWDIRQGADGAIPVSNGEPRGAWPSRPGEPQHGWEPPRVVGNSERIRLEPAGDEGAMGEEGRCAGAEGGESPSASQEPGDSSGVVGNSAKQRCEGGRGAHDSGRELLGSTISNGSGSNGPMEQEQWQTQPPMGGDLDGASRGMGYAELQVSCDNRTDELRMLGNGVVPQTCERAVRTLLERLK